MQCYRSLESSNEVRNSSIKVDWISSKIVNSFCDLQECQCESTYSPSTDRSRSKTTSDGTFACCLTCSLQPVAWSWGTSSTLLSSVPDRFQAPFNYIAQTLLSTERSTTLQVAQPQPKKPDDRSANRPYFPLKPQEEPLLPCP